MKKSIRLFIKPYCGWCHEAMAWLDGMGVEYQTLNVSADRESFEEMVRLTGQAKAPVIEVDGEILADFGVDELQAFWKQL